MVLVLLLVVVVALTTGASATGRLSGSLARCLAAFLRPSYGLAALLYYIVLHHFYMILYYILLYYNVVSRMPCCSAARTCATFHAGGWQTGRLALQACAQRYFTIDFGSQIFFYSHNEARTVVSTRSSMQHFAMQFLHRRLCRVGFASR